MSWQNNPQKAKMTMRNIIKKPPLQDALANHSAAELTWQPATVHVVERTADERKFMTPGGTNNQDRAKISDDIPFSTDPRWQSVD
jgi:hypothetical protein